MTSTEVNAEYENLPFHQFNFMSDCKIKNTA